MNTQTPTGPRDKHSPLSSTPGGYTTPARWKEAPQEKLLPSGKGEGEGNPPSVMVVISLVLTLTVFLDIEYVVYK